MATAAAPTAPPPVPPSADQPVDAAGGDNGSPPPLDPPHPARRRVRRPPSARALTWATLTPAERDAITAAATDAAARAAVGVGAFASVAAGVAAIRRQSPPLPRAVRLGSLAVGGLAAAYAGAASAVPAHATALMGLPDSRLAEELRTAVGDWGGRIKVKDVADVEPDAVGRERTA
ncbi:hypothetical protein MMPV_005436 [Pyropia vietnamensis]